MSITLTLPVEILENIDIVTTQANQITKLRLQLEEANALNSTMTQRLMAAEAEIRSLKDQVSKLRQSQNVPKPQPVVIKPSTSTTSLRPTVSRNPASEPTIIKVQPSQKADGIEPDVTWKQTLKKKIEDELRPMVNDAKESYETKLKKSDSQDTITRSKASIEYNTSMATIRGLASEQFQTALERERQERRWAAGLELSPEWGEALIAEQQLLLTKFAAEVFPIPMYPITGDAC
ncbi:hypothetical protein EYR40_005892 [Pleurotus pulmonarius]|nr:hypothetical protein EYR36_005724 [Pleurotus pulmonarius]KAF4602677.1 hypothetical protein EYR40_005892 [Pleurotus pulmonarius]